jgi:uncharacterized protein with ParB-like and HNH nuclease domain/predicted transport protein
MKAVDTELLKLIKNTDQFVVPIYQRTYSWTVRECEQLWNDIVRVGTLNNETHFIGSIVYFEKDAHQNSRFNKVLVIDGQQRLTTVSLILAALSMYMKTKPVSNDDWDTAKIAQYLVNNAEKGDNRYKIILSKGDNPTFQAIIDSTDVGEKYSIRIKENYDYLYKKISERNFENITNGLLKIKVVDVTLQSGIDNPQLIFESFNSTGLGLAEADLIRNHLLMMHPLGEQDHLYENYWYPMEEMFGQVNYSRRFDRFIRDYLTLKTDIINRLDNIYVGFKEYIKASNVESSRHLADLKQFSEYYAHIALGKEPDLQLKSIFSDINTLRVEVAYPFIMQLYFDYKHELLSKDDFMKLLRTIESYVFRRSICGVPTNSLNKTFAALHEKINKVHYLESIYAAFNLSDSYRRFPKDEEFKNYLVSKDVYNYNNRNYLLQKLENFGSKEYVDVSKYTIEHIMPQTLTDQWREDLGSDWEEIFLTYLHTLGNLTLTGYNSELSQRPFLEKKNMPKGFAHSPIVLNETLSSITEWRKDKIEQRASILADKALKIWNYPEISPEALECYKKEEAKKEEIYTLSDHPYVNIGGPMNNLFEELRLGILNIDASVHEEIKKLYIAYKANTNFVDLIPYKNKIKLSLNIEYNKIDDPQGICRDVTHVGTWGNGDVEVEINSKEQIAYSMQLIKQAFDYIQDGLDI